MIRPILDGVLVLMDAPPAMTAGGLYIPDEARADPGTWRAQRAPKIGTVLAVGPGRFRSKRTDWMREHGKVGPYKPDELARMYAPTGSRIPMTVQVGDRVLFDPGAELREVDPAQPLLRMGAEFQVAWVIE